MSTECFSSRLTIARIGNDLEERRHGDRDRAHQRYQFNTSSSSPDQMVGLDEEFFFQADDGLTGIELWKSDGTGDGTSRSRTVNLVQRVDTRLITNVDSTLFFQADDGAGELSCGRATERLRAPCWSRISIQENTAHYQTI